MCSVCSKHLPPCYSKSICDIWINGDTFCLDSSCPSKLLWIQSGQTFRVIFHGCRRWVFHTRVSLIGKDISIFRSIPWLYWCFFQSVDITFFFFIYKSVAGTFQVKIFKDTSVMVSKNWSKIQWVLWKAEWRSGVCTGDTGYLDVVALTHSRLFSIYFCVSQLFLHLLFLSVTLFPNSYRHLHLSFYTCCHFLCMW